VTHDHDYNRHRRGPGPGGPPREGAGRQGFGRPGFGPGGPGGFGGWGGVGRGRGPGFRPSPGGRARRGDVQTAILALLADEPMHGYQVIQELAERSGGAWNPGPGSVYPTLQAMEDQGLVSSEQVGSRRTYSLTDAGRALLESQGAKGEAAPWDDIAQASGPRVALRQAAMAMFAAAGQVERTASDEQVERATALIDTARKGLYALLAE